MKISKTIVLSVETKSKFSTESKAKKLEEDILNTLN